MAYTDYVDQHPIYLGGSNIIVQADETVIYHQGIIRSSIPDDNSDIIWIGVLLIRPAEKFLFKENQWKKY